MNLVPPWAKAAAVLGLKMQIAQLEVLIEAHADINHRDDMERFFRELERIEAMK